MESQERVAGVILAGGRSRRMGGTDKASLQLGGETLLERAVARLAPQVSDTVISAKGDLSRFASYAHPVVADSASDHSGRSPAFSPGSNGSPRTCLLYTSPSPRDRS